MLKKIVFAFGLVTLLAACKKEYQCQCTNANNTYDAGDPVEARTKRAASKTCDQELSGGSTKCSAK
ncbi:MAG: hypothetical protein ACXVP0_11525 [Bacteroidia bacterium]